MKIAIMQPYLLPYPGYYQLIRAVDKFVFFDDVHYINRGWINRNRLVINGEPHFFTAPLHAASQNKRISEIELIDCDRWKLKLEKTVLFAYRKSLFFSDVFPLFQEIISCKERNLSAWLLHSFQSVLSYIGNTTAIVESSERYKNAALKGQERIADICLQENATVYVNPIGGKLLYDACFFHQQNLDLKFISPVLQPYPQAGHSSFIPALSILDLLMNLDRENVIKYLDKHQLS